MVWPPNQMSFSASAPMLSLAISTAPASLRRFDDRGILLGDAVAERLGAVSGGNARGVEEIFCAPGNAVQRAAILAGGDFRVGAAGLLERVVGRRVMMQRSCGSKWLDAVEIEVGEALRGELAFFDPAGELA